jgi:hypothetical protein
MALSQRNYRVTGDRNQRGTEAFSLHKSRLYDFRIAVNADVTWELLSAASLMSRNGLIDTEPLSPTSMLQEFIPVNIELRIGPRAEFK